MCENDDVYVAVDERSELRKINIAIITNGKAKISCGY